MMGERFEAIVDIRGLSLEFPTYSGPVKALSDISLEVFDGEIVGLVGESGCGKSVTAMALMRLLPEGRYRVTGGSIHLLGRDLLTMPERELQELRGGLVSMIFQEPMNALNPTIRIGRQLIQVIRRHRDLDKRKAGDIAERLLNDMQIPEARRVMDNFPFELSGGMRQRVLIAMAFSCEPRLLIADEPTTALDVTVQAQVLTLVKRKALETGTAVLFISHNMAVVSQLCDRMYVMYAGKIVETGRTSVVLRSPRHPYSDALLRSLPERGTRKRALATIPGTVPTLLKPPEGCVFEERCPEAHPRCGRPPPFFQADGDDGHLSACWLYAPEDAAEEAEA